MRTALAVAAVLLSLTACSSGEDDGGASGGATSAEAPAADDADSAPEAARSLADGSGAQAKPAAVEQRAVIATGDVALRGDDVGQALVDVRRVVDGAGGEVEEENTETDRSGAPLRSRLVLRVPEDRFDETLAALKEVATLVSSSSSKKDVTTEVLDVGVRVEVQRRSIERIAALLDQATSIRDVVAIEAQLSQRQADLASLEKQQEHLAGQTSMSTVTVSVERTRDGAPPADDGSDDAGFLRGLDAGWHALATFAVGLATFLGAILPWLVVLLVLGLPGLVLVRRLRGRTPQAG